MDTLGDSDTGEETTLRFVAEQLTASIAEAEAAALALGYPLWVRSCGADDPHYCARLDAPGDLPLVWQQAAQRGAGQALVQRAIDGPAYRLWLPNLAAHEQPLILQARYTIHHHVSLVEGLVLATLPPEHAGHLHELARHLRTSLCGDSPWVEVEVIATEDGPVLSGVWRCGELHPVVFALKESAATSPAAGACWLQSRSGKVVNLEGLDAAQSQPGVVDVHVGVRAGDVLYHVVDEAARDRLGHVVAVGNDAEEAESNARIAAGWVRILTTAMLD